MNGKVEISGRMAARVGTSIPYLGVDIGAAEVVIAGEAKLKNYFDVASTLGIREQTVGAQKTPRQFIKGTISLAGELLFSLMGSIHFEVLYNKVLDNKLIQREWPIANGGLAIDFDYNIGDELTKEKLAEIVKIKKEPFHRSKFVRGVLKDQTPKQTTSAKGHFLDEQGKAIGDASDTPIPIPQENIMPQTIQDDFMMNDVWHYLEIEMSGPGQPVKLTMASITPRLLADKIREQKANATLSYSIEQDADKKKKLEQMIADLDDLQKSVTVFIHRVQRLGLDPHQINKNSIGKNSRPARTTPIL